MSRVASSDEFFRASDLKVLDSLHPVVLFLLQPSLVKWVKCADPGNGLSGFLHSNTQSCLSRHHSKCQNCIPRDHQPFLALRHDLEAPVELCLAPQTTGLGVSNLPLPRVLGEKSLPSLAQHPIQPVEEFFLSGGPSSSAEVRMVVVHDVKKVEGERQ